jgi:chemotaxis protein MotB
MNDDPLFEKEDVADWIFTYADLMSLLLVFFILLFSMTKVSKYTLESALSSIQIAMNSSGANLTQDPEKHSAGGVNIVKPEEHQIGVNDDFITSDTNTSGVAEALEEEKREEIEEMTAEIHEQLEISQLSNVVSVQENGDQLIITVDGQTLFESGDAELSWQADYIFEELLKMFQFYYEFSINIKGHTDNIPIRTVKFPSNWELSAIRATTVLRYFLDQNITPQRMTATGYADSVPIAPNDTEDNRALNRRVEFVLEKN